MTTRSLKDKRPLDLWIGRPLTLYRTALLKRCTNLLRGLIASAQGGAFLIKPARMIRVVKGL